MYTFKSATSEYAGYLNMLCRASAIMLGIGDKTIPYTSTKLKNFDYSYWSIRKKYNYNSAISADKDPSVFNNFWPGGTSSARSVVDAAIGDTSYVNFFLNGSETSVSESINTSVSDSPLDQYLNVGGQLGDIINYFTGSGFNITAQDAGSALEAVFGSEGTTTTKGLLNLGQNILKGGKLVLPKMLSTATYGRSVSCNMRFVSPYGDPYSIFLKCIVPICHLLAMALPKQIADNMYTYPFVVRAAQLGRFTIDLGVISNITVTRGGSDDTSWTVDSLATEWDVQLELVPLVDELMITSTSHPFLFVKNEGLLDYLANFCGFDMLACNLDTKLEMMANFFKNRVVDIPPSISNKVRDSLYNKLNKYFTLNS
jgi:hypothetical protein